MAYSWMNDEEMEEAEFDAWTDVWVGFFGVLAAMVFAVGIAILIGGLN